MKSVTNMRIKVILTAMILGIGAAGIAWTTFAESSGEGKIPAVMMPSLTDREPYKEPYKFEGALDIRIHPVGERLSPPAELLLIDPQGRKVGNDPRTSKTYAEIPNSSYERESIADDVSGAPGPETAIIHIGNPASGEYSLRVIGRESSQYDLEIRGYDCEMDPADAMFTNVTIQNEVEHTYLINYSNKKGSKIEARRSR
jgi:hypothetical protein